MSDTHWLTEPIPGIKAPRRPAASAAGGGRLDQSSGLAEIRAYLSNGLDLVGISDDSGRDDLPGMVKPMPDGEKAKKSAG